LSNKFLQIINNGGKSVQNVIIIHMIGQRNIIIIFIIMKSQLPKMEITKSFSTKIINKSLKLWRDCNSKTRMSSRFMGS